MSIKVLKLISGEELIGSVDESEVRVRINKPCLLHLVPSKASPDQTVMALIPYATYVDGFMLEMRRENVLWVGEPIKELYNQYNSAFGTGIQLAGL